MIKRSLILLAAIACSLPYVRAAWANDVSTGQVLHVIVMGEVRVPGQYAVAQDSSIDTVLTQAGNVTEMAGETVYIERADETGQVNRYPVSLHDSARLHELHLLRDGDKVVIPHAVEYSIVGEVQKPGAYRLDSSLTVTQALAKAGGGTVFANHRRFEIRRKSGDRTVVVQAKADDFVEPGDVIRVKVSYF
jgi:polysaccharide biosynthesis/export protein